MSSLISIIIFLKNNDKMIRNSEKTTCTDAVSYATFEIKHSCIDYFTPTPGSKRGFVDLCFENFAIRNLSLNINFESLQKETTLFNTILISLTSKIA